MDLKTYITTGERGTAAKLAAAIGVSPSYLSQMASGTSPISPERCVEIERATKGVVGRKDLRPTDWQKIWPELVRRRNGKLDRCAASDDVQNNPGANLGGTSGKEKMSANF